MSVGRHMHATEGTVADMAEIRIFNRDGTHGDRRTPPLLVRLLTCVRASSTAFRSASPASEPAAVRDVTVVASGWRRSGLASGAPYSSSGPAARLTAPARTPKRARNRSAKYAVDVKPHRTATSWVRIVLSSVVASRW